MKIIFLLVFITKPLSILLLIRLWRSEYGWQAREKKCTLIQICKFDLHNASDKISGQSYLIGLHTNLFFNCNDVDMVWKKTENNNNNNNIQVIPLPLIPETEKIDDYTKSKWLEK